MRSQGDTGRRDRVGVEVLGRGNESQAKEKQTLAFLFVLLLSHGEIKREALEE